MSEQVGNLFMAGTLHLKLLLYRIVRHSEEQALLIDMHLFLFSLQTLPATLEKCN